MKINRPFFYDTLKSPEIYLFKYITAKQITGFELILNAWEKSEITDMRWLAYMLATTYHETGRTMQPIEEYGKGKKHTYGQPDPVTKKAYYGRGLVQLTWKKNYDKMGTMLGIDLVNKPELACNPNVAVDILFLGMCDGFFTGKSLGNYFAGEKTCDWYNARKIINGLDRAEDIAGYAKNFLKSISTI